MYLDGRTQGRPHWYPPSLIDLEEAYSSNKRPHRLFGQMLKGNCPHADKMRLKRVPKWLQGWHDPRAPLGPFPRASRNVLLRSPLPGVPF